jgi:hypothetical protein
MRCTALLGFLCLLIVGCGDGTIQFGGGAGTNGKPRDTIVVQGNIRDVNPQVAGADTVVFVYTDLQDPGVFNQYSKQRSVAVASDAQTTDFSVTQVKKGNITIVFLQDHASNPDGTIDPGDSYATLDDPDKILRSAKNGQTFQITDVDIDFQRGTANAVNIRSIRPPATGQ